MLETLASSSVAKSLVEYSWIGVLAIKIATIFFIAQLVVWRRRRLSSTVRHFVWTTVLVFILALVPLGAILPSWQAVSLPFAKPLPSVSEENIAISSSSEDFSGLPAVSEIDPFFVSEVDQDHSRTVAAIPEVLLAATQKKSQFELSGNYLIEIFMTNWPLFIWATVSFVLLLIKCRDSFAAVGVCRRARLVNDPAWKKLFSTACRQTGVS